MSESLERALGRLEGKVDRILDVLPQHEERIVRLETWKARLMGAAALAGFLAGLIARVVWR